jgi:hypothetical protein
MVEMPQTPKEVSARPNPGYLRYRRVADVFLIIENITTFLVA